MRRPHAGGIGDALLEQPVSSAPLGGERRYHAVGLVSQHAAIVLEHARLHGKQIVDELALGVPVRRDAEGAVPGRVRGPQLVQRVHQGVAARQRDRHQVRLSLHLVVEGALGAHHAGEDGVENRAQGPDDETHDPAEPGDPDVHHREAVQEPVEAVALVDDVRGHALGDEHPATHGHRALREVPELVREHRTQLPQREHIDEPQADVEVLPRREDEVEDRKVVEDTGVHPAGEEHPVGPGRARLVRDPVKEREEARLGGGVDLDRARGARSRAKEQRLQHEERQERQRQRQQERQALLTSLAERADADPPGRPDEPPGERRVDGDEREQRHERQRDPPSIAWARRGQVAGDLRGGGTGQLFHARGPSGGGYCFCATMSL